MSTLLYNSFPLVSALIIRSYALKSNFQIITIISDFDRDELVVPQEYLPEIERIFEFAYNRADDFSESENGVMLNISGSQYPVEIGDKAQAIYQATKA